MRNGQMTEEELTQWEERACPGCGSCAGMFTANSMNCLAETIGVALPGNGTIPAVHAARVRLAKQAGMRVMDLVKRNIRPPRHRDPRRRGERHRRGHGPGLLHQHHPAPARHLP